ncbi:MAG TPA: NADH-ubiquinone oxidoreductase-F iron-sulfur binding region domain-containing protein [Myxococcota bacterium]|nr:NADH-ubiquinone oxidoreductase-F iron-sulfur binding region domain-containing protein [Myxococcota bacterium]HRY95014.1 NADH-ubiquinone oxidoreductase-F iron-sulfur binding region domain-containing protein [Myxococcota bacterium]HSA21620.1 NADH-ubiquinone oxidoreductase-F iron-sulfur binding region domain-containing protein [Myxococcota bacterium]
MANRIKSVSDLEVYRKKLLAARDPKRKTVAICTSGCTAYGSMKLNTAFREELRRRGLEQKIDIKLTGCHGYCERGPLVVIHPAGIFYQRVKVEDVPQIIERTLLKDELVESLLFKDADGKPCPHEDDVPFYKHQMRVLLANNSRLDPTSLDDYIALGGYQSLAKALSKHTPEALVKLIKDSGLRGRGGGGFPAGVKWESCRKAPSADGVRYIICNADEGDPGAFMDRAVMEGNPHLVLEGMIIGAFAIGHPGDPRGYIYIRNEYPLAVERVGIALQQAREYGLLGKDILGTGFSFDIKVNKGGGAFVCGESTALMASIEGDVGEPRAKHIHTVEQGLYDKPTNLNNVETWANVPLILERGLEWFTGIGTGDVKDNPWGGSKGTKIFALVGKVNNTGLVEVPMGASLRDIIFKIGGGIIGGKKFKAVQTGGPSGGCLPDSLLDMTVDFDKLSEAGSMMGSGGMIVMDESTCMVDVARYFLHFLAEESCGKCVTCREGLVQLCVIVDRICAGQGKAGDLELLEELGNTVADASLCALGQTAPNPLRSTIRYFREEYERHIRDKRCPAKVCKALITFSINDKCTGCTICAKKCPQSCISGEKKKLHTIDQSKCIKCGVCNDVCNFDAVSVE